MKNKIAKIDIYKGCLHRNSHWRYGAYGYESICDNCGKEIKFIYYSIEACHETI